MKHLLYLASAVILLSGCVSQKKYAELQKENERLQAVAPAAEAKKKAETEEVAQQMDRIRQLELQVQTLERNEKEFNTMMEAGKIPQPTSEQMRMYEMQQMEKLSEPAVPGHDPMAEGQSELKIQYEQMAFENRTVTKALEATLDGFNKNQISYDNGGGRSVVCISNKELFEPGTTNLSDMGKGLVARIGVSVQGMRPLHYRIIGITEKDDAASLSKANARAMAVYEQLTKEEGQVRLPNSIGASPCDAAAGKTDMNCDRIELIFEQNYEVIMGQVEATIMR